jgi:hypothetical protein
MEQRTTVTDPRTWPPEIRDRYGVGARPRWLLPALVLGVLMVTLIAVLGVRTLRSEISAGLASFTVQADDHVELSFAVRRSEATPATCVVRARADDGFDVGYAVVRLPAAEGHTGHTYQLRTAYRALLGELLGCAVGDQPPPNVAPAQFRPGVVPPEQPWSHAPD